MGESGEHLERWVEVGRVGIVKRLKERSANMEKVSERNKARCGDGNATILSMRGLNAIRLPSMNMFHTR